MRVKQDVQRNTPTSKRKERSGILQIRDVARNSHIKKDCLDNSKCDVKSACWDKLTDKLPKWMNARKGVQYPVVSLSIARP